MTRTPLIAGNWKMNGTLAQVEAFAAAVHDPGCDAAELLVCPPLVHVERMSTLLAASTVCVGAQNLAAPIEAGAYTGEVSGAMLVDAGASHVIIGHSERRALYGETDAVVAEKTGAAEAAGLVPIVCVGETLAQREAGDTEAVLGAQIDAVFAHCQAAALARLLLAYEPVWAIGTGRSATPEQAQATHAFIRDRVRGHDPTRADSLRVLYGGSVKPDNARALFAGADVDGALVGGASLAAESFLEIARAAG